MLLLLLLFFVVVVVVVLNVVVVVLATLKVDLRLLVMEVEFLVGGGGWGGGVQTHFHFKPNTNIVELS